MRKYRLICSSCRDGLRYGISVEDNGRGAARFEGLSDDVKSVEELVAACAELDPSPCHLGDIIEDFLTDFCI